MIITAPARRPETAIGAAGHLLPQTPTSPPPPPAPDLAVVRLLPVTIAAAREAREMTDTEIAIGRGAESGQGLRHGAHTRHVEKTTDIALDLP